MFALCPSLKKLYAASDTKFHGLVVAGLKVQAGIKLAASPVAAIEGVRIKQIERGGDRLTVAQGEDEQKILWHPLADESKEDAIEIRRGAVLAICARITRREKIPVLHADLRAHFMHKANTRFRNLAPFLL